MKAYKVTTMSTSPSGAFENQTYVVASSYSTAITAAINAAEAAFSQFGPLTHDVEHLDLLGDAVVTS